MIKDKKHTNHKRQVQKRKSSLQPPYYINKNLLFDYTRKRMAMKTDGPTLNEISSIDTTGNVIKDEAPRATMPRPVSTTNQLKNWVIVYWKEILIGIGSLLAGLLVIEHGIQLTKHDKDIEYFQKNEIKQDGEIELLKEKSNEMNIDIRLIEQRIELETEKNSHSQIETNNK